MHTTLKHAPRSRAPRTLVPSIEKPAFLYSRIARVFGSNTSSSTRSR